MNFCPVSKVKVFSIKVWLLILVSLIVVGPIIYGIMKLRKKIYKGSKMYTLSSCIWFVYGALMKQGSSLSPENGCFLDYFIYFRIVQMDLIK